MPLTRDTLRSLIEEAKSPALTITFPTFRSPPDVQQNPVRYKNLLRQAETEIGVYKHKAATAFDEALNEAWRLVDDTIVWEKPLDGVAVFVCPGMVRLEKMSFAPPEAIYVKETFALRPFVPLFAHRRDFLVLAAAFNHVCLYESGGQALKKVEEKSFDQTIDEIIAKTQIESSVNFHTTGPVKAGRQTAAFHALGESPVDVAEDLRKEFGARIARAVDVVSARRNHPPVVLVADDRLAGGILAHAKADLVYTLDTRVSPNEMTESELLGVALDAFASTRDNFQKRRLEEFQANYNDPESQKASVMPPELALAALQGRIQTLFVLPNGVLRGRVNETTGAVTGAGQRGDLIDDLVRLTLHGQGEVLAVGEKMLPNGAQAGALYRW